MGAKVGVDCKLYRNTGTYGTPTWNEVTTARDVTLNMARGEANSSSRASRYTTSLPAMLDLSVDFSIIYDPAVDDYDALQTAFISGTTLDIAVADGAIATTGTRYFRCDYIVTNFSHSQPLTDAVAVDVTLKPTYSSNTPGFTTVS